MFLFWHVRRNKSILQILKNQICVSYCYWKINDFWFFLQNVSYFKFIKICCVMSFRIIIGYIWVILIEIFALQQNLTKNCKLIKGSSGVIFSSITGNIIVFYESVKIKGKHNYKQILFNEPKNSLKIIHNRQHSNYRQLECNMCEHFS